MAALEALAAVHAEHGHLQEVILQNFVPHPRYYGAEPAEIADEAQRTDTHGEALPPPAWATPVSLDDMRDARARVAAADARRGGADPAEPLGLVAPARGRGRHRPRRAVRERRPHLARASVPVGPHDAQAARAARLRAHRAPLRVPAVHGRRLDRAGRARRDQGELLELHPAPRLRPPRGAADPARPGGRGAIAKGRDGTGAGRGGAHGAVRGDAARGDRGHAPGGRRAAPRAGGRDGDVRREPEHQRLEHLHGRLRVLRLRPGQALPGRLRARPRGAGAARARGGGVRRHGDLHAVRHPPRLGARGLRALAAGGQGGGAGDPPARLLADGGVAHERRVRPRAARGVRASAGGRALGPRRARPPRCSTTACASGSRPTSCRWRAGWR